MNLSGQTQLLLVVVGALILIIYFYNPQNPIKNSGTLSFEVNPSQNYDRQDFPLPDKNDKAKPVHEGTLDAPGPKVTTLPPVTMEEKARDNKIKNKFMSKNLAKDGMYKTASYAEGERGNGPSDFDKFFDQHNALIMDGHTATNEFSPNDETNGQLASYKPGRKRKLTDEDIFKSEDFLPQELNKDWFEVLPEPISVKNRHLINVTRPIGVSTVGNSHRNMSYDIRGTPVVAKTIWSPIMNSSIDPDLNLKGLC